MAVDYIVAREGTLVVEKWVGAISHTEMIAVKLRQFEDPHIAPGARVLSDCTRAISFETSFDRVGELAAMHGEPHEKPGPSALAIVVSDHAFERATAFSKKASPHGLQTIVFFHNLDAAATWIGIDTGEAKRLLDTISV